MKPPSGIHAGTTHLEAEMIILGVIALVIGYLLNVPILWTIG